MNIDLPRDTQYWLDDQAARSGMTAQQFAKMVILDYATMERHGTLAAFTVEDDTSVDHEKWMVELRAWSKDHPGGTHFVDDSRESIYEGRGL